MQVPAQQGKNAFIVGKGKWKAVVHRVHGFSLAESLPGNESFFFLFSSVHHSVVSDSATSWTAARQASLSIANSRSLLKLMSIELVTPSNHLILCRPLLPPSIFPSIRGLGSAIVTGHESAPFWSPISISWRFLFNFLQLTWNTIEKVHLRGSLEMNDCPPRGEALEKRVSSPVFYRFKE